MEKIEKLLSKSYMYIKENTGFCTLLITIFISTISFGTTHFWSIYIQKHFNYFDISTNYIEKDFEYTLHFFLFILAISFLMIGLYYIRFTIYSSIKRKILKETSPFLFHYYSFFISIPFITFLFKYENNLDKFWRIFTFENLINIFFRIFGIVLLFLVTILIFLRKNKQNKIKYIWYFTKLFFKYKIKLFILNITFFSLLILVALPASSIASNVESSTPHIILTLYLILVILDFGFSNYKIRNIDFKFEESNSNNYSISEELFFSNVKKQIEPNLKKIISVSNGYSNSKKYFFKKQYQYSKLKIVCNYKYQIQLQKRLSLFIKFNNNTQNSSTPIFDFIVPFTILTILFYIIGTFFASSIKTYSYEIVKFKNKNFISVYTYKNKLMLKKILFITDNRIQISAKTIIVSPNDSDLTHLYVHTIPYDNIRLCKSCENISEHLKLNH